MNRLLVPTIQFTESDIVFFQKIRPVSEFIPIVELDTEISYPTILRTYNRFYQMQINVDKDSPFILRCILDHVSSDGPYSVNILYYMITCKTPYELQLNKVFPIDVFDQFPKTVFKLFDSEYGIVYILNHTCYTFSDNLFKAYNDGKTFHMLGFGETYEPIRGGE